MNRDDILRYVMQPISEANDTKKSNKNKDTDSLDNEDSIPDVEDIDTASTEDNEPDFEGPDINDDISEEPGDVSIENTEKTQNIKKVILQMMIPTTTSQTTNTETQPSQETN